MGQKFFFVFLLFFYCWTSQASYKEWFLKGSIGVNYLSIPTSNDSKADLIGITFSTQLGHRFQHWGFDLDGFVTLSRFHNVIFELTDKFKVSSNGIARSFSLIPMIKYFPEIKTPGGNYFYFGFGPNFSLRTFYPKNSTIIYGTLAKDDKISIEESGGVFTLGLEGPASFNEENPSFTELILGYSRAQKITLVDASNTKKVRIRDDDIPNHSRGSVLIMVHIGMTFF